MKLIRHNYQNYGRRFVIGDIHGCFNTLKFLLEKRIKLQKNDCLYLLGDYINKGPLSANVLDYIILLQSSGFNIYLIKGNHEENFYNLITNKQTKFNLYYLQKNSISEFYIKGTKTINHKYIKLIEEMVDIIELPDYYLSHYCLLENINWKKIITQDEIMNYKSIIPINSSKRIIFGHYPTSHKLVRFLCKNASMLLPLDSGCCYNKYHRRFNYKVLSKLTCLNLDNLEVIFQNNIDKY